MPATVYGSSKFGVDDDSTALSLYVGDFSANITSEQATVTDHLGSDVGLAVFNPMVEVQCSGVVKTSGSAMGTGVVGSIITTINNLESYMLNTATGSNSGKIIVTDASYTRANKDFEQGSFTAQIRPGITGTAQA